MKLFDAHTHLNTDPLVQDREWYLKAFVDAWGAWLVNSGADEQYNLKGIEIAKLSQHSFPSLIVKSTLGLHPQECVEGVVTAQNIPEKITWLKNLYLNNKEHIVAIGECGIDLHYPHWLETLDVQKQLFIEHCKLARELNLPLVIHSRDAFAETFEILNDYTDLVIYFHCRGYGVKEFEILNSKCKKLYVGFCGNVTYKNADNLRETLKIVPLSQLLLETDAPYLAPQVIRGETNHPANVVYIYNFVAEYLSINPTLLSDQIEHNFLSVYAL